LYTRSLAGDCVSCRRHLPSRSSGNYHKNTPTTPDSRVLLVAARFAGWACTELPRAHKIGGAGTALPSTGRPGARRPRSRSRIRSGRPMPTFVSTTSRWTTYASRCAIMSADRQRKRRSATAGRSSDTDRAGLTIFRASRSARDRSALSSAAGSTGAPARRSPAAVYDSLRIVLAVPGLGADERCAVERGAGASDSAEPRRAVWSSGSRGRTRREAGRQRRIVGAVHQAEPVAG
jgi:hypothetical protein